MILIGGGAAAVLALVAVWFVFLKAPDAPPPPPPKKAAPPAAQLAAKPTTPQGQAVAAAQQAAAKAQEQLAPLNEVLKADQPAATTPVVAAPAPLPAPVVPSGPPPPSPTFRAWVVDLRINVRTGVKPRIQIERTTYDVGDTVNQTLGITFVGYNAETRVILFKDKSGAIVERRN